MTDVEEKVAKSRKPPNDGFRQQKLQAWQPIMTPIKIIALFITIGKKNVISMNEIIELNL